MNTSPISSVGDTEEDFTKKNYWSSAFASLHPSHLVLPFVLSVVGLTNIAKTSCFLIKRDIHNLTDARKIQEKFSKMDLSQDPHLDELQKDLIHTVRKLAVQKIIVKIALISSFALLSIGEYWALCAAPVRNIRLYSLLGAAVFGATSTCQYAYQGVEGLLLERLVEMEEN